MAQRSFSNRYVVLLCRQRRNERSEILYWQQCDDGCRAVETSANIPLFSYTYGAMNFMAVLAIRIQIAISCYGV